jgi:hypothetical protein
MKLKNSEQGLHSTWYTKCKENEYTHEKSCTSKPYYLSNLREYD